MQCSLAYYRKVQLLHVFVVFGCLHAFCKEAFSRTLGVSPKVVGCNGDTRTAHEVGRDEI